MVAYRPTPRYRIEGMSYFSSTKTEHITLSKERYVQLLLESFTGLVNRVLTVVDSLGENTPEEVTSMISNFTEYDESTIIRYKDGMITDVMVDDLEIMIARLRAIIDKCNEIKERG